MFSQCPPPLDCGWPSDLFISIWERDRGERLGGRDLDISNSSPCCRVVKASAVTTRGSAAFRGIVMHGLNAGCCQKSSPWGNLPRHNAWRNLPKTHIMLSSANARSLLLSIDGMKGTAEHSRALYLKSRLSSPRVWHADKRIPPNRGLRVSCCRKSSHGIFVDAHDSSTGAT